MTKILIDKKLTNKNKLMDFIKFFFGKIETFKNFTERVGFEPTNSYLLNDFESFAFNHSATSPPSYIYAHKFNFKYDLFNYLNF